MVSLVTEDRNCCGCKACGDACEVGAIKFEVNQEGFWYPRIDEERCVSCQKCRKVCPSLNIREAPSKIEPAVFAAWMKDKDMRLYSTSGGMYYPAAKRMLAGGGCIVACRFTEDWKHAEHIVVQNEEELMQTVRSKYFQSDTEGIYKQVKRLLDSDREVLFCGCPCQCAALLQFLGKDYNNLFTMDFICRGINSQKAFAAFIEELEERYQSKAISVHCKNKRKGWTSLGVLVQFENGEEYYETRSTSYWSLGYIRDNLYMRPGCHHCHYRTIPRISDITIGDFWGIKGMEQEEIFNGVSVLMVNTDKGQALLERYKEELVLIEKTVDDVYKGNPCLFESPKEGTKRSKFFELLDTMNFSDAVQECCGKLGC